MITILFTLLLTTTLCIVDAKPAPVELLKVSAVQRNTSQNSVIGVGVCVAAVTVGLVAHGIGSRLDFYSKCSGLYAGFVAAFAGMAGYVAYCTMRTHSAEGMVLRTHDICVGADQKLLVILQETKDIDLPTQLTKIYHTYEFPLSYAYEDISTMRSLFADAKNMMFQLKNRLDNPLAYERDLYIQWLDEQLPYLEKTICVIGQNEEYQEQAREHTQAKRMDRK